MSHSFSKLETLLYSKEFIPVAYYTIDGYIVYIEVFSQKCSDTFLIYIPSKYNIKPEGGTIYKIKYVDIVNKDGIVANYAEEPDMYDIKQNYDEINIEANAEVQNMEDALNENYNKEIMLKDINKDDKDVLTDIFRQLTRFKFCVQNIQFKLGIIYKNYMCCIKRDDSIECYLIKNYPAKKSRRLVVTIDLKSLYEIIDSVPDNLKIVKTSIFKILNQNQLKHNKVLFNILENKDTFLSYSELIYKKKEHFDSYISELENMRLKLKENEDKLIDEKIELSNKKTESGMKGFHEDIQQSHTVYKLDSQITKIKELVEELDDDIIKTKLEQEDLTLKIDKILFDNSVMLNEIIKNFNSIIQIIE